MPIKFESLALRVSAISLIVKFGILKWDDTISRYEVYDHLLIGKIKTLSSIERAE